MFEPKKGQIWLMGDGIASMAAAAFLIRDAGLPGCAIHILEQLDIEGGSLDGGRSPDADWKCHARAVASWNTKPLRRFGTFWIRSPLSKRRQSAPIEKSWISTRRSNPTLMRG